MAVETGRRVGTTRTRRVPGTLPWQPPRRATAPAPAPVRPARPARRVQPVSPARVEIGGHLLYEPMKRALDVAVSLAVLVLGGPLLLLISLVVVLDDRGPVLYRARRVGRGGREIVVLKFRSMRTDSEAVLARLLEADPAAAEEFRSTFKLRRDPRRTRIGSFLRRTSLDELPQFLNVLRGNMTLVGPRPIVEDELGLYRAVPGGEEGYLAVTPGITGLWQVSGRSDLTYAERVRLDLDYVRSRGLRRDFDILLKTPAAALKGHGAY